MIAFFYVWVGFFQWVYFFGLVWLGGFLLRGLGRCKYYTWESTVLIAKEGKLMYISYLSPVVQRELGECWSHTVFTLLIWEYICKSDSSSWLRFSNLMHV